MVTEKLKGDRGGGVSFAAFYAASRRFGLSRRGVRSKSFRSSHFAFFVSSRVSRVDSRWSTLRHARRTQQTTQKRSVFLTFLFRTATERNANRQHDTPSNRVRTQQRPMTRRPSLLHSARSFFKQPGLIGSRKA
jgi:hypothetical protein